jgi:hypothetical protein
MPDLTARAGRQVADAREPAKYSPVMLPTSVTTKTSAFGHESLRSNAPGCVRFWAGS